MGSPQTFVANLWTEFAAHSCEALAANGKEPQNPWFPWWLQLSKRQILTFLSRLTFGTVRSEVRILSPRPVTHNSSIIYRR